MAKGAQIVGREPARAAERFRTFSFLSLDHLFETSKVFSQAIHPVQVPDVKQAMKYCMGFG